MAVVRWDPIRELAVMQDRLNRVFGDQVRRGDEDITATGEVVCPVDIHQNDRHEIVLQAELPGVAREDLDLRVEGNTLTIRGQRKPPADVKDEQYHRRERVYGTFSRSFTVPNALDTGKIRADLRDGILTIALPAREESKPRQIQVQVG